MPTKNNIKLSEGKMYFATPEGYKPLGDIQEIEFTEEPELDILGESKRTIVCPTTASLSAEVTVSAETVEYFRRLAEAAKVRALAKDILDNYPNRRIVHLATRHRNPLVRKKNQKRIVRYYGFKL